MYAVWHPETKAKNYAPSVAQLRVWRVWGRTLRRSDTYAQLQRIESARDAIASEVEYERRPNWLLGYRPELRRLFRFDHLSNVGELDTIRYYLANCPREMIPIVACVIGRMSDRFHLYELTMFCHDPSPQVRKHVAKALRRLEAWTLLDEMARAFPDDAKIEHFATAPTTRRPFAERLVKVAEHLDHSRAAEAASAPRMPYWSRHEPWEGQPPKAVWYIRWILQRIRQWVHGG